MPKAIKDKSWKGIAAVARACGVDRDTIRIRAKKEVESGNSKYRRIGDGKTSPMQIHVSEVPKLAAIYGRVCVS